MIKLSTASAWRIFQGCVVAATALAVAPLALRTMPALQDYPQHLFQAAIWLDPATYGQHYAAQLRPGPYALFFWLVGLLSFAVPVDIAGRIVMALHHVLLAAYVWTARRNDGEAPPPWGLLLLFPLALGPMWYLGFAGYSLSLPLLLLALRAWRRADGRPRPGHLGWLALLFVAHPFSTALYVGLCGATTAVELLRPGTFLEARGRRAALLRAVVPLAAGLLLALWLLTVGADPATSTERFAARWLPLRTTLGFASLAVTGLSTARGVEWLHILPLAVALAVPIWSWPDAKPAADRLRLRRALLWVALCLLGLLVLPYEQRHYTYINLRFLGAAALLLAVATGAARLTPARGALVAAAALLLLGVEARRQLAISAESEEILPLLAKMRPNSRVLPLVFDNNSVHLDASIFDPQIHSHAYYHLRVGGGYSPYMFETGLNPVRIRSSARLPAPHQYQPAALVPALHVPRYDWVLARGGPSPRQLAAVLRGRAELVGVSGRWTLLRAQPPAKER